MLHDAGSRCRSLASLVSAGGGAAARRRDRSADDTARFLAGMPPSAELAARAADAASRLAAARAALRRRLRAARAAPALQDPRLVGSQPDGRRSRSCSTCSAARTSSTRTPSSRTPTTYVLSGARAGRRRSPTSPGFRAARCAGRWQRCTPRWLGAELQLLHHQQDEDAAAREPAQGHAADPLRVPGALGQDDPRRQPRHLERRAARSSRGEAAGRGARPAASKIVFAGSDGEAQTLYYFSTDLSDDGVERAASSSSATSSAQGDSFVKSASYLLHSDNFSKVRDFLLAHSALILQDDTGIPVAMFDRTMAAAPVRALSRADQPVRGPRPAEAQGPVPDRQPRPDRLRGRLPVAAERIEPPRRREAGRRGAGRRSGSEPGRPRAAGRRARRARPAGAGSPPKETPPAR